MASCLLVVIPEFYPSGWNDLRGSGQSSAAELWRAGTLEQRQKLQGALFPTGLVHDGENFRTAVTCIALNQLQHETGNDNGLARPAGFEPATSWFVAVPGPSAPLRTE